MARKSTDGGPNRSEAIREMLSANPDMKVKDVVAALSAKGIEAKANLVYLVKGKMKGEKRAYKKRGRKPKSVVTAATTSAPTAVARGSAVQTILKVKALADEVGGLKILSQLVAALGG